MLPIDTLESAAGPSPALPQNLQPESHVRDAKRISREKKQISRQKVLHDAVQFLRES